MHPSKLSNEVVMSLQIGLFYGSTTCYTEIAAEKIQQAIGEDIIAWHLLCSKMGQ